MSDHMPKPNRPDGQSKEFMLAQYRALSDSFWRNEEQGERRVNFLIALVTAVIAALVALAEVKDQDLGQLLLPSLIAVTALLLLGIVTWRRLLARNRATDEYKRGMEIIRDWFEGRDPQLAAHRPFPRLLLSLQEYDNFRAVLQSVEGWTDLDAAFESEFKPDKVRLGAEARIRAIRAGRTWLVAGKPHVAGSGNQPRSGRLRTRRHLLSRAGDKLAVYRPRRSNWGGLAESVGVMNSIFLGILLVLVVLLLDSRFPAMLDPISVGDSALPFALLLGLLGVTWAVIAQHRWMMDYYEGYQLHLPEANPGATGNPSPLPQEQEIAFRVSSPQPEQVVARLGGLSSLAGHQLVPGEPQEIRDVYFDTQAGALQRQRLALRVRHVGPERWLAFKGPSKATEWGGVKRLELEEPWSRSALEKVIQALVDHGIDTPQGWRFSDGHPRQVLAEMGFQVIQDRRTRRQVRDIVPVGQEGGPAQAEFALDAVVFRLGDLEIRHYEVEIESKTPAGTDAIAPLSAALTAELGAALKRWNHPKLAVGLALEVLWKRGELDGLLDASGHLTAAAYDRLDDYLRKGNG